MIKKISKKTERGQAIILVAASMIGIVAFVGLMVDGGLLVIEHARLKRGIDAASVAAAAQFRKGYKEVDIINAGEELLHYNQADATVTIATCKGVGVNYDASLCPTGSEPPRKLVRVTATRTVNFSFLPVVGIKSTTITATAVGEAASINMVLVLDTSSSQAYQTTVGGNGNTPDAATSSPASPGDDPRVCNATVYVPDDGSAARATYEATRCEPMGQVIDSAVKFVNELFFPYDQIAIVTSTSQTTGVTGASMRNPTLVLPFNNDASVIKTAIQKIKVLSPAPCANGFWDYTVDFTTKGICILLNPSGLFYADTCLPLYPYGNNPSKNPTTCGPSNIGGALYLAGDQFASARQDTFWVVINIFGGPANGTSTGFTGAPADGFCPASTFSLPGGKGFCRDEDPTSSSRHRAVGGFYPAAYDADDFARDAADYITSPTNGQGGTIFSICIGNPCRNFGNPNDPASGEHLGQYMAYEAGKEYNVAGDLIADSNHGIYYYSPDSNGLDPIFKGIADNIFTRISQ